MKRLLMTLVIFTSLQSGLFAQTYSTLYSFTDGIDGGAPSGKLVSDANGNLYGATYWGGSGGDLCGNGNNVGCGTIFELTPNNGVWTETVLYSFSGGADGGDPNSALIFDSAGNLYGTTQSGGNKCSCGVVFELSPGQSGWTETVLHRFSGKDGSNPWAGLTMDAAGNLYGSTTQGGLSDYCYPFSCGTIFKLSPNAGTWTFQVIYGVGSMYAEGVNDPLILDSLGNLYGTASGGHGKKGFNGSGIAFKLSFVNGHWTHTTLHIFSWFEMEPIGGLVFDAAGNLYGATASGEGRHGSAYELVPIGTTWQCKLLNRFSTSEGNPTSGIVIDASGNLYGATDGGITGWGSFYKLTLSGSTWVYSDVHDFDVANANPEGNLLLDGSGNLYGVTDGDLVTSWGSVYEIQP